MLEASSLQVKCTKRNPKCLLPSLAMSIQAADLLLDVLLDFCRAAGGRVGDERMRLMTLAEGPARLSLFSTAQVLLRPRPRTADCLAVVSKPAATKAARISASFEACLAFARPLLLRCRIAHTADKFVSLLVLGSVVSGLRYSSLRALPEARRFGCVSLKNVTNALRQLGICQHALGRFGI